MKRLTAIIIGVFAALLPAMALAQEELPPTPEAPPANPISASTLDGLLLMSEEAILMAVAGAILSVVYGAVSRTSWASDVKWLGFFAVCVVFGILYSFIATDDTGGWDISRRILFSLGSGVFFYTKFAASAMQTFTARTDTMLNRTP